MLRAGPVPISAAAAAARATLPTVTSSAQRVFSSNRRFERLMQIRHDIARGGRKHLSRRAEREEYESTAGIVSALHEGARPDASPQQIQQLTRRSMAQLEEVGGLHGPQRLPSAGSVQREQMRLAVNSLVHTGDTENLSAAIRFLNGTLGPGDARLRDHAAAALQLSDLSTEALSNAKGGVKRIAARNTALAAVVKRSPDLAARLEASADKRESDRIALIQDPRHAGVGMDSGDRFDEQAVMTEQLQVGSAVNMNDETREKYVGRVSSRRFNAIQTVAQAASNVLTQRQMSPAKRAMVRVPVPHTLPKHVRERMHQRPRFVPVGYVDLYELDFAITRVHVTQDMSHAVIYWTAPGLVDPVADADVAHMDMDMGATVVANRRLGTVTPYYAAHYERQLGLAAHGALAMLPGPAHAPAEQAAAGAPQTQAAALGSAVDGVEVFTTADAGGAGKTPLPGTSREQQLRPRFRGLAVHGSVDLPDPRRAPHVFGLLPGPVPAQFAGRRGAPAAAKGSGSAITGQVRKLVRMQTAKYLNAALPAIRWRVGEWLGYRYVPSVKWEFDDQLSRAKLRARTVGAALQEQLRAQDEDAGLTLEQLQRRAAADKRAEARRAKDEGDLNELYQRGENPLFRGKVRPLEAADLPMSLLFSEVKDPAMRGRLAREERERRARAEQEDMRLRMMEAAGMRGTRTQAKGNLAHATLSNVASADQYAAEADAWNENDDAVDDGWVSDIALGSDMDSANAGAAAAGRCGNGDWTLNPAARALRAELDAEEAAANDLSGNYNDDVGASVTRFSDLSDKGTLDFLAAFKQRIQSNVAAGAGLDDGLGHGGRNSMNANTLEEEADMYEDEFDAAEDDGYAYNEPPQAPQRKR